MKKKKERIITLTLIIVLLCVLGLIFYLTFKKNILTYSLREEEETEKIEGPIMISVELNPEECKFIINTFDYETYLTLDQQNFPQKACYPNFDLAFVGKYLIYEPQQYLNDGTENIKLRIYAIDNEQTYEFDELNSSQIVDVTSDDNDILYILYKQNINEAQNSSNKYFLKYYDLSNLMSNTIQNNLEKVDLSKYTKLEELPILQDGYSGIAYVEEDLLIIFDADSKIYKKIDVKEVQF